jgi:hypothetical protein
MALTTLTRLPAETLRARTVDFLKRYENAGLIDDRIAASGAIHDDGRHLPTVGYGLNLKALTFSEISGAFRYAITGSTSGRLSASEEKGLSILKAWKADATPSMAEDLALIAKSADKAGTAAEKAALKSLWLSDAEATRLLTAKLTGAGGLFDSVEAALDARLKALGASMPAASQEKLVLMSLYYNAPGLIGNGIATAIRTDDHARFWYEIRYNHLNYDNRGLQNRREAESNSVGILAPEERKNALAQLDAMDTLFDRAGGAVSIYEKIAARDAVIRAGDAAEADTQSFAAQIAPAMKLLAQTYAAGKALHFVQVGGSGSDTFTAGVAKHLGRGESSTNDLVRAGDGDNSASTGGGNDWVYTGKGKDRIALGDGDDHAFSGAGNDRIDGGRGADRMNGGTGYDVYVIDNAGDTVIDSDRGAIETSIGLKTLSANIDSYSNLKAGLVHALKLDPAVVPKTAAGEKTLTFIGSGGNDAYRFALTGDALKLVLKTGGGSDTVIFTDIADADAGTTAVSLIDPGAADRFDFSAFDAAPIRSYDARAENQAGDYFYGLKNNVWTLWFADDVANGGTQLHAAVTVSGNTQLLADMFIV